MLSFTVSIRNMNEFRTKFYLFRRRNYKAQNDLDIKLKKFLNKRNGFFIEIGANDGIHQSNTFYLEKNKNWSGLLVEPGKEAFSRLIKNRSKRNIFVNAACVPFYYDKDSITFNDYYLMGYTEVINSDNDLVDHKNHSMRYIKNTDQDYSTYSVPAIDLNTILLENNAPRNIDFFSLDVEGEELSVLEGLDFQTFNIELLLIESRDLRRTTEFLNKKNMSLIEEYGFNYLFKRNI